MTGWRLGYGVFPSELAEPVTRLVINSVSCVPEFVQLAGMAALNGPWDEVEEMRDEYPQRRDLVVERLNSIDGVPCVQPSGAFYASRTPPGSGARPTPSPTTCSSAPGSPACPGPPSGRTARASCGCRT